MFNKKGYINIDEVLKDKYNYNFTFLDDLKEQPFGNVEPNGKFALVWITIDGEKYLFKKFNNPKYDIWGELLSQKIAQFMGIECAEYRAASLGGTQGLLTKNFLKENERLKLGSEILNDFFKNYPWNKYEDNILMDDMFRELYQIDEDLTDFNNKEQRNRVYAHLNNILDLWNILEVLIKDKDSVRIMVNDLLQKFIFDCITLQFDRHPNNWGIISDGKSLRPAPLFDNAYSLEIAYEKLYPRIKYIENLVDHEDENTEKKINKKIYNIEPSLTLKNTYMRDGSFRTIENTLQVFEDLIIDSDSELIKEIYETLESLNDIQIERLIIEAEEENGIKMPNELHYYVTTVLHQHIRNMKNVIREHNPSIVNNKARKKD